mgnify:CR=1 FL=1
MYALVRKAMNGSLPLIERWRCGGSIALTSPGHPKNHRSWERMVPHAGIEPALLSELDFERPKGRYSKHRRLQVKARKPTTINDLA